jgi:acetyl esterase/lipase
MNCHLLPLRWLAGALLGVVLWTSAGALEPTFRDIPYGPHERNKFDLWQAPSAVPTPLIVHIHGGGFYEGGKGSFWGSRDADLVKALDAGVSVASINYRFLESAPLQDILRDSARALQFMRRNAAQWNLDKTRVAAYGDSAGAGTSLWLAFHDDLADPNSPDPVLRESTRLTAAAGLIPQATYDFAKWPAILGIPEYVWFVSMPWIAPKYYHLWPRQTMLEEQGKKLRADLDILSWIDPSDPPVYLNCHMDVAPLTYPNLFQWLYQEGSRRYLKTGKRPSVNVDILHHPAHTRALERACNEKGVPCMAVYRDTPPEKQVGVYDFLLERLRRQ